MSAPRTLVVARHAKAEPDAPIDAARPLSVRGWRQAGQVGEWLVSQGFEPDQALVSTATRTRQTYEAMAAAAGWTVAGQYDSVLYNAAAEDVVALVHRIDPDASSVLVVGHNPTMAQLARLLDDGEGDPPARAELTSGFPTASLAWFELDGGWLDLELGTARLVSHHRP